MAKLSARGRTEVVRVAREHDPKLFENSLCDWERVTLALMSDGNVLKKLDVRFRADGTARSGERYSYGWKVLGKFKGGGREDFLKKFPAAGGWEVVR